MRPKVNEDRLAYAQELINNGMSIVQATHRAGIGRTTYYRYKNTTLVEDTNK